MGRRAAAARARARSCSRRTCPGFGSTPERPGELSLADYVLGTFEGAAALVGTSFGGRAVLETALAAPERVTQLVLIGANLSAGPRTCNACSEQEEALFDDGTPRRRGGADGALVARRARSASRTMSTPSSTTACARWSCASYELQAGAEGVAQTRRHRACRASPHRRSSFAARSTGRTSRPRRERFVARAARTHAKRSSSGCAHLPTMERPDEVARLILDFAGRDLCRGRLRSRARGRRANGRSSPASRAAAVVARRARDAEQAEPALEHERVLGPPAPASAYSRPASSRSPRASASIACAVAATCSIRTGARESTSAIRSRCRARRSRRRPVPCPDRGRSPPREPLPRARRPHAGPSP